MYEKIIEKNQLLEYEIAASWWAKYITHPELQELSASYFAWKVKRKYKRYTKAFYFRLVNGEKIDIP